MPNDIQTTSDFRLQTPAVLGLDEPPGQAMALVNRILRPQSTHDAANALFDLLELTVHGPSEHRSGVVFFAQLQAMLYHDDWETFLRRFVRMAKESRKGGTL